MWFFQHFMKDPDKADLPRRVSSTKHDVTEQKGKIAKYCPVVNYLLVPDATEDVIIDMEEKITNFKHREGMSAVRYLEVL